MQASNVYKVHDYETFRELVSTGLVVIDFSATWCGPCRKISPIYEVFANEYTKLIPELKFIKVDVDEVPLAAQGVSGLPTFQFWVDNQKVDSLTVMGASVDKLKSGINDLLKGNYVLPVTNKVKDTSQVSQVAQVSQVSQMSQQEEELESTQELSLKRSSSTGLKLRSKSLKNSQAGDAVQNF
ncbi:MAG: thioredoxin family protein [Candidatus Paceibacterota bacterium]